MKIESFKDAAKALFQKLFFYHLSITSSRPLHEVEQILKNALTDEDWVFGRQPLIGKMEGTVLNANVRPAFWLLNPLSSRARIELKSAENESRIELVIKMNIFLIVLNFLALISVLSILLSSALTNSKLSFTDIIPVFFVPILFWLLTRYMLSADARNLKAWLNTELEDSKSENNQ